MTPRRLVFYWVLQRWKEPAQTRNELVTTRTDPHVNTQGWGRRWWTPCHSRNSEAEDLVGSGAA